MAKQDEALKGYSQYGSAIGFLKRNLDAHKNDNTLLLARKADLMGRLIEADIKFKADGLEANAQAAADMAFEFKFRSVELFITMLKEMSK